MFRVGNKVKLKDNLKVGEFYWDIKFISEMKKYEGKEARIVEVNKRDNYRLDIDDGCFWYSAEMLELVGEFKVGDKVKYHGCKATIWGIAEKEDRAGTKYGITYRGERGILTHDVVSKEYLSSVKSKNELEEGDKFRYGNSILTVKCRHKESDGGVYYFAVDENNVCNLYFTNEIEVL